MGNEYYQTPKQLAMIDRENRMAQEYKKITTHCECGHSFIIPNYVDRLICRFCGNWCYRTKELEKQYKEKETLIKLKKYLKESEKNADRVAGKYLAVKKNQKNTRKSR